MRVTSIPVTLGVKEFNIFHKCKNVIKIFIIIIIIIIIFNIFIVLLLWLGLRLFQKILDLFCKDLFYLRVNKV